MISRRGVLAAVGPAAAAGALVAVQDHWNQYTSDSVAQQSLIRTWLDAGHGTAYVPSDTWILKLPLYLLVEALPLSPGARLLIDVVVLNAVCFGLLGWAAWLLARYAWPDARLDVWPSVVAVVAPLVWLACLSGELSWNKLQPNYRNIELGLVFLALAAGAAYLDRAPAPPAGETRTWRRRAGPVLLGLLMALGLALLWVDDPYFLILTGVPFGLACLAWFLLRRRFDVRLLEAVAVLVASIPIMLLVLLGLDRAGLYVVPGSNQTSLSGDSLRQHLDLLVDAVSAQLGLSQSDPAQLVPGTGVALTPVAAGLTVFLGVLAVLAGLALLVHGWRRRLLLPAFAGVQWLAVAAGFVVSVRVNEVAHGRYLILAFYALAVTLAIALPGLRMHWPVLARFVVLLLAVSAAVNVTVTVQTAAAVRDHAWDRAPMFSSLPTDPAQEKAIQDAVAATGIARGYAQFWSANLTLYRSGGKVSVNSVHCIGDRLVIDDWLTDTARRGVPSARTFLIVEPYNANFRICTPDDVEDQFGPPSRIVPAGQAELWIYDRDINPEFTL